MKNFKFYLPIVLLLSSAITFGQSFSQWQNIDTGSPSARMNHTMVTIETKVYLFGGETTSPHEYFNDLWEYSDATGEWSEINPSGDIPAARAYHTATYYDGKMYVFGGTTSSGTIMDIWEYDPQTNVWTEKATTSTLSDRLYHRATTDDDKIWITGGMKDANSQATGEIWCYDVPTNTWVQKIDCPAPRYGHVAYYYDNCIYIVAGRNGNEILNDRWKYDISTNSWTNMPASRLSTSVKFSAFAYNDLILWMSGGTTIDGLGNFTDVPFCWQLGFALNLWSQLVDGPVFSFGAASMLLGSGKNTDSDYRVLVFGGSDNGELLDDTWIYNSSSGWNLVDIPENDPLIPEQIRVFPSITADYVNICSNNKIQTIEVYSLQGALLLSQKLNDKESRLDLSSYNPGTYLIVIGDGRIRSTSYVILKK
jgi:N-acetylneuraminic acid mutarotase